MKLFPQPITSPSRLDKFPSPLTRSLRSKSRGGSSRLNPLFIRKKNETTETQEPSSPKVTCFGQVEVTKSNQIPKKSSSPSTPTTTSKHRHGWIQKISFCGKIDSHIKKSPSVWRRWGLCLQFGVYHRKVEEIMEESAKNLESRREDEETENYRVAGDEEMVRRTRVSISTSPPKNALLLMRSRSENYRPSSLANLLWGSPLDFDNTNRTEEAEEEQRPKSRKEPEIEENCEEIESSTSIITTIKSSKFEEDLEKIRKGFDLPSVLRRSKSEPARISREFEFDSENYFWRNRRLGCKEQFPPHF